MSAKANLHPAPDRLVAFAQGRLPPDEMSEVEQHVGTCDSCCHELDSVPPDTLQQLARDAATAGFRSKTERPAKRPFADIPPELRDHARYKVLGLVGTGGMGAVYKAEHRLMERLVALKVISPSLTANPQAVERFHREFRSAAKLSHPNIVVSYDADREGDLHFLVMEFVEGLSLDRLVEQRGPLPVPQACHLVRQAAMGLAHIHEKGMVHRDIKPQNLMVTRKGQLKILDCGLARLAREQDEQASHRATRALRPDETAAGMILGTPDYIAPEQVADSRMVDIRSDLYSLGCTLYFALTGEPPFPTGTLMQKLASHANSSPESILARRHDVAPQLAEILNRLMAKDPAKRFQSPAELTKALAPFASDKPGAPAPKPEKPAAVQPVVEPGEPAATAAPMALDPLADLALSGSLGNLPPIHGGRPSDGNPFNNPRVVPIAIACGIAVAMIVLATAIASRYFPDEQANGKQATGKPNVAARIPAGPAMPPQPPSPQATSSGSTSFTGPGSQLPPEKLYGSAQGKPFRILFVVPSTGLYGPDFYGVVNNIQSSRNLKVQIASTRHGPIPLFNNGPSINPPRVNIHVPEVKADNYDAVIFTGYNTDEFADGGVAQAKVSELIADFQAQNKVVAAICRGQRVLARHGVLKGKIVAECQYASDAYAADQEFGGSVVRDGLVVTAATSDDAAQLVEEIEVALQARK